MSRWPAPAAALDCRPDLRVYRVTTDQQSQPQIDALPSDALAPFAEVRTTLEVAPWGGDTLNDDNPDAPVRTLAFGPDRQGLVTYLILDEQRRVDVLDFPTD
ncbi:MAG: hypothetical protein M3291_07695 [Actinomycetota bacterium]|nr:hypothetical protein [Actinomycetota bacterium]